MLDTRRVLDLCATLVLACSISCAGRTAPEIARPGAPQAAGGRPNIVMVVVDDLRWDDLGYAGHPFSKTPHIDRIAAEGVNFTNAFATTPLCSPSRASILTGLYAHSHGIVDNTERGPQSHQLNTFPRALKKVGYRTGFVGKWHMGNDDSPRPGFDYWVALSGQGSMFDASLNDNGTTRKTSGYVTDVLNGEAVKFIDQQRQGSTPFLLYLSHKAIHPELKQYADGSVSDPRGGGTFIPAERHRGLYAGQPIPRRANYKRPPEGKPALERALAGVPPLGPETATPDDVILDRLRMLVAIDEGVGELRKALEALGRLDDTMIIVVGDHGYFYGEHGLNFERRLAYEETARIPLVVRFPSLARPGRAVDDFVLNIDLAPTLIELAGASAAQELEGRSWLTLLRGQRDGWRTSFLIEYYSERVWPRMVKMGYRAIRTKDTKFIHYLELQGMDEIYDLASDPHELKNIVATPRGRALVGPLWSEMSRLCGGRCPELEAPYAARP